MRKEAFSQHCTVHGPRGEKDYKTENEQNGVNIEIHIYK